MRPYTLLFCVGFLAVDVLFAVGRELRNDVKNCLPVVVSLNVYSGNCFFGRNLEKSYISLCFVLEIHKKMKQSQSCIVINEYCLGKYCFTLSFPSVYLGGSGCFSLA